MKGTPEHEPGTNRPIHKRPLLHVGDVLTAMRGHRGPIEVSENTRDARGHEGRIAQ